jgi:glycosyltransferase involved in cell wall biosynthesis
MLKSISLVLPLFNEIGYIRLTIEKAICVLDAIGVDYEIIIVDDASYDGSEKIAGELAHANNKIKIMRHSKNRKLGSVLRSGFSCATKDVIIYTDMDMPFDLLILKEAIPLIDKVDIVNGYRIGGRRSLRRIIYSQFYNYLLRAVFNVHIKDFNFAMKIFKRDILPKLDLRSQGSFISAEFLIKARYLNYKILEIPVRYEPRKYGKSRLSSYRVIFKVVYEMIKLYCDILAFKIKTQG